MKLEPHRRYKPVVKRKCVVCGKLSDDIFCSRDCVIQMQIVAFGAPISRLAHEARKAREAQQANS